MRRNINTLMIWYTEYYYKNTDIIYYNNVWNFDDVNNILNHFIKSLIPVCIKNNTHIYIINSFFNNYYKYVKQCFTCQKYYIKIYKLKNDIILNMFKKFGIVKKFELGNLKYAKSKNIIYFKDKNIMQKKLEKFNIKIDKLQVNIKLKCKKCLNVN